MAGLSEARFQIAEWAQWRAAAQAGPALARPGNIGGSVTGGSVVQNVGTVIHRGPILRHRAMDEDSIIMRTP